MADQNDMYTLTAVAESYDRPFKRFGGPINVPTDCEDAGGFFDNTTATFRMNLHWFVCLSATEEKKARHVVFRSHLQR
jgi:hypothetical protein